MVPSSHPKSLMQWQPWYTFVYFGGFTLLLMLTCVLMFVKGMESEVPKTSVWVTCLIFAALWPVLALAFVLTSVVVLVGETLFPSGRRPSK